MPFVMVKDNLQHRFIVQGLAMLVSAPVMDTVNEAVLI